MSKREPLRRCVICAKSAPKALLLRFVLDHRGKVVHDPHRTMPGRGAYLCRSQRCLKAASLVGREWNRAFKRPTEVDPGYWNGLREQLNAGSGELNG